MIEKTESNSSSSEDNPVKNYIPLIPGIGKRRLKLAAGLIPAMIILISVPETIAKPGFDAKGWSVLALITCVAVMTSVIRNYRHPGAVRWLSYDTSFLLSGLMLIIQGGQLFDTVKGIQPAHLFFLVGTLAIFKGTMYPETRIQRGFVVDEKMVRFKKGIFGKGFSVQRELITSIDYQHPEIHLRLQNDKKLIASLKGYEQQEETTRILENTLGLT
jgi:hypothetical protein